MKYPEIVNLIPFPSKVLCLKTRSIIANNSDALFDDPSDETHSHEFYTHLSKDGWETCPKGYGVYSRKIPGSDNLLLITHGLKVKPFWTKQGRSKGLTLVTNVETIEKYVSNFINVHSNLLIEIENNIDEKIKSFSIENIHEIRSINSSLYNIGYELQERLHYEKHDLALAKNVVALSELISTRIDLTDISISSNENDILKKSPPVPVFKMFDKIIRCYIAYASKRKIVFKLDGNSRGQSLGLEHFELIPMILIDNAVKYSPNGHEIKVNFRENNESIFVDIISLGPKIYEKEKELIFNKSYRGKEAINSKKAGSGIGLFFVKKLMKSINSFIEISQDENSINYDRKTYYSTKFSLFFCKIK